MKTVKIFGAFFLLAVFLFSTTGISFLHHICNSSQHEEVTLYPEFFNRSESSCCGMEETASGGSCQYKTDASHDRVSLNAVPCCISSKSLLRLQIVTERTEKLLFNSPVAAPPDYSDLIRSIRISEPVRVTNKYFQFYSPPLFGKQLVYFLHQSKIPAHPVLS